MQMSLFACAALPDPPQKAPGPMTGPRLPRRGGYPPLRLCVLGSGSGGNASVVQTRRGLVLVDAGFGPRTTANRLYQAGVTLAEVQGVLVTHLDADHFRPTWPRTLLDLDIPLYLHRWHLPELRRIPFADRLEAAGLVKIYNEGDQLDVLPDLTVTTVRLQHDRQGTIGFRLTGRCGVRIGYATDLGHAPAALINHFAGVDVLCIESNYDVQMTKTSSRPSFVNRRNLSDSGHLSNEQAFEAVSAIRAISVGPNPRRVVLLHRSGQCNHPTKVRRVFERDPALAKRTTQTDQRRRTRWITMSPLRAVERCQLTFGVLDRGERGGG